jgi:adenylosuccinate synthase
VSIFKVTGRRRRCGWFDSVALRRSVIHSSVTGLCVTKLDVLDGLDTISVCTGYKMGGEVLAEPPMFADAYATVQPIYEELPGWKESTIGITEYDKLPGNARRYLERLQQLVKVPIDMISTGPDREETIVLKHSFG